MKEKTLTLEEKLARENQIEEEASWLKAKDTKELVSALYKDDLGRPFGLTDTQQEIFDCIFKKQSPDGKKRIHIMTHTQYGKSDVVSMAVLTRVSTFPEKWVLVAPSQAKARIIMGYIIKHLFENEYTFSRFRIEPGESEEAIRRERSKSRLTFNTGDNKIGEVFILSAESRLRQSQDIGNSLMGFGAPNLVEDEAALISNESDAKAMRMVGGFSPFGTDFVVKIGNPFTRGHFLDSHQDPNYYKVAVDYHKSLREKNSYGESRLTEDFIKEMNPKPYFKVLYECVFPQPEDIDSRGWTQLLSDDDIDRAMVKPSEEIKHAGEKRIGNDVARGGANETVWALRSMNYGEVLAKSRQDNLTDVAAQTIFFMKENGVLDENTFIDDIGVGGGAIDPLLHEGRKVRGVNAQQQAIDLNRFINTRAEAYWRLREWIKRGGRLSFNEDWYQLSRIKYKPDSKGRIRIMSKDDMRGMGMESPDTADALMLTFVRKENSEMAARRKERKEKRRKASFNRGLKVTMGGY